MLQHAKLNRHRFVSKLKRKITVFDTVEEVDLQNRDGFVNWLSIN